MHASCPCGVHAQAAAPDSDDEGGDGLLKRVEGQDTADEDQAPTKELLEQVFDPGDEKDRFLKEYIATKVLFYVDYPVDQNV